jgi:hypothetical protein
MDAIQTIGRAEPDFPLEPSKKLRDMVEQRFTDIKTHISPNAAIDFAMASGTGFFRFGPEQVTTALPGTPVRATMTLHTPGTPALVEGVCFAALGERYGHPFTVCKGGAACPRMHFHQLPTGTTRTSLTALLVALKEGALRTAILEGMAKDPDLLP